MSKGNPHWISVYESRNVARPWRASYDSKAEALREARKALAGCHKGSGYVMVFDGNPAEQDLDPIKTLRA